MKYKIVLVGYKPTLFQKEKHTNFWPWKYLKTTLNELGFQAFHENANKINHKKPHIYICWNEPDSIELLSKYSIHKDSIIIQKLTSFDTSEISKTSNWTKDPYQFLQKWNWPQYQKLNTLSKTGYQFYAFGAKTEINAFPTKEKIVNKFKDHIFWIPWGSMTIPYKQIQKSKPIMDNFKYDIGFVGSKWGKKYRGNLDDWDTYLEPLLNHNFSICLAGLGTKKGPVNIKQHISILKKSKLCPIFHAASWRVEKGIMDRFWTVFSLGRFGIIENEGIFDFFNSNEVVYASCPEEYYDKSIYFIKNTFEQEKYITAILNRIKTEYNQHHVWSKIMKKIESNNR